MYHSVHRRSTRRSLKVIWNYFHPHRLLVEPCLPCPATCTRHRLSPWASLLHSAVHKTFSRLCFCKYCLISNVYVNFRTSLFDKFALKSAFISFAGDKRSYEVLAELMSSLRDPQAINKAVGSSAGVFATAAKCQLLLSMLHHQLKVTYIHSTIVYAE